MDIPGILEIAEQVAACPYSGLEYVVQSLKVFDSLTVSSLCLWLEWSMAAVENLEKRIDEPGAHEMWVVLLQLPWRGNA